MFSGASLTSWGQSAFLALVGHRSSDGVTIKMPFGVNVLHRLASDFFVRLVKIGFGRRTLVVVVDSVDSYLFLAFSDLTCHFEDTGLGVFWLHCAT